ncbi:uncharacterized protein LOC141534016 [Cotesia typhae]|uniref:uncharacterized protein LOC141534016 n=1 Tax=Cotesia typhae TaxID=2053667 RepID=UPI003D69E62F
MATYCNKITTATITTRVNNFKRTLTFLIIPTISHVIPNQPIQREKLKIPANIKLADPTFHKPGPIDLLIGAGTTLSVLSIGQIPLSLPNQQEVFLQKTLLVWIVGGAAPTSKNVTAPQCHATSTIHFDLTKFWEIEECPTNSKLTPEEIQCELHFQKHVSRTRDG